MDVKQCDRCGGVYSPSQVKGDYRFRVSDLEPGLHIADLCPKCMQELDNFMGNKRFSEDFLAIRQARKEERLANALLNHTTEKTPNNKYPIQNNKRYLKPKYRSYGPNSTQNNANMKGGDSDE